MNPGQMQQFAVSELGLHCLPQNRDVFGLKYPKTYPEVIKLFSYSTQLSLKLFLLKNVKMPTIVGILTFMNMKNSNISLSEPKKC